MNHEWKDIPDYPIYKINKVGQVISKARKTKYVKCGKSETRMTKDRLLKPNIDKYGYHVVTLYKNGRPKTLKVHRLVLLAFIGPSKLDCNHINGVKSDNRIENLEYCSVSQNNHHKTQKLGHGKLSKSDVINIFKSDERPTLLAKRCNVDYRHIWAIKNGVRWSEITSQI